MMRKLSARALLCLSLCCASTLHSALVLAAPPRAGDDDTTVAIARERFKEGVAFFDQKQYDKARAAFLQAYALKKHPAVLLNLAQSELRSGHEADAAKHFSGYLREAKDASEAERQAAEAGLAAAKLVVAEVAVSVDESAAEIYVDGTLEGNSPLPGPVFVTPGTHSFEARKDGRSTATQMNASASKQIAAQLTLAAKPVPQAVPEASPAPEPAPGPTSPSEGRKPFFKWLFSSPVGVLGVSLTGVGLGSGIGFSIASSKSYDNADADASQITKNAAADSKVSPPDTSSLCLGPTAWLNSVHYTGDTALRAPQYANACSTYQDDVNKGDTMKTVAMVGFVVSGVAAVGTVLYYFVDPEAKESHNEAKEPKRQLTLVPSFGPSQTGLSVAGSF